MPRWGALSPQRPITQVYSDSSRIQACGAWWCLYHNTECLWASCPRSVEKYRSEPSFASQSLVHLFFFFSGHFLKKLLVCDYEKTNQLGDMVSSSIHWQAAQRPLSLPRFLIFFFLWPTANWFWLMLMRLEGGGELSSPCYHGGSCHQACSLPLWGQPLRRSQLRAMNFPKEHLRLQLQLCSQGIRFCLLWDTCSSIYISNSSEPLSKATPPLQARVSP